MARASSPCCGQAGSLSYHFLTGSRITDFVRQISLEGKGEARRFVPALPPQIRMSWQLVTPYSDYLFPLSLLLRDPLYRGSNVQQGRGQPILLIPEVYRLLAQILGSMKY
ncbi:MAG: hypothetical protein HY268_15360 [Deltaproteobacteria bacterium]|nr:hypothetical protein [Deltaproteobacteria bacterium]